MTKEQEDAKIARSVREHTQLRQQISMLEDELRGLSQLFETLVYPLRRGDTEIVLEKLQTCPEKSEIVTMVQNLARGKQRRAELKELLKDWGVDV